MTIATNTAQERFEYHLAGLKAAAEEMDPTIGFWDYEGPCIDSALSIKAVRRTGQYEGDGIYEGGSFPSSEAVFGVELVESAMSEGERAFNVTGYVPRGYDHLGNRLEDWNTWSSCWLSESRLRTFIRNKLRDFQGAL